MNVNPSVLICVESSERLRQTLQLNAQLDEVVEEDDAFSLFVILLEKHPDGGIGQSITETRESLFELVEVDLTRVVPIETAKALLPIRHVLPQSREFVKSDGSCVILVEHHDH